MTKLGEILNEPLREIALLKLFQGILEKAEWPCKVDYRVHVKSGNIADVVELRLEFIHGTEPTPSTPVTDTTAAKDRHAICQLGEMLFPASGKQCYSSDAVVRAVYFLLYKSSVKDQVKEAIREHRNNEVAIAMGLMSRSFDI